MPRPSKRTMANRKRARDPLSGRLLPSNSSKTGENSSSVDATPENCSRQDLKDRQLCESHAKEQVARSSLSMLSDNGSSKRPRNGHYKKNSRTTEWRKSVEASHVKESGKLGFYGFKPVDKVSEEKEEQHIPHTKQELSKIK